MRTKWGLLYGVILCNARSMGEFGAVSVVSGHIRGETNTLPLQVEILYNVYNFAAAFAVASLRAVGLGYVAVEEFYRVAYAGRNRVTGNTETDMSIQVKQLTKRFGNFVALENVTIDFPPDNWQRCSVRQAAARRRCYG